MKPKDYLDHKYTKISLYVIVTAILIYILYAIAKFIPNLFGYFTTFLGWIMAILTPLFWGFVFYYLLAPFVDVVQKIYLKLIRRKSKNNYRTLSITTVFVLLFLAIFALFSVIISAFTKEIQIANVDSILVFLNDTSVTIQNFISDLIRYLEQSSLDSSSITTYIGQITNWMKNYLANFGTNLLSNANQISSFFTNLIFSIIFGIYFLADFDGIKAYWSRALSALTSQRFMHIASNFLKDCDTVFSGYIRGQVIDASFMAVTVAISLSFTNVKFPLVIGLLAGLGNLIPYVGSLIAIIVTVFVCLINADFVTMIICIAIILIIQMIDGNVVNPRLLSHNVNVHPIVVAIALIIGGQLAGILGMLFAVPCAALLKLLFDRFIDYITTKRSIQTDTIE